MIFSAAYRRKTLAFSIIVDAEIVDDRVPSFLSQHQNAG